MHPPTVLPSLLLVIAVILLAIKWQETRELKRTLSAVFHRIEQHPLSYFTWSSKVIQCFPGLWLFIFEDAEGEIKRTQLELTTHRSRESLESEIGGKILLSLGPLPYAGAALAQLGKKRLPSREEEAAKS